ncbi:Afadin-and alpha-actinin-binding protein B [Mycena venus]|uniref:Afadin-and alpha-actinin-binding protein B n=1 Tax=Mycena venus TaxID=2733690 RepID=A0A8H6YCV9_9AGAR|nr:Afadin-and alpha-actinin-binding protein B [Mycena venus]
MLGNSPATPNEGDPDGDAGNTSTPLEALLEEDEGGAALVDALFPEMPAVRQPTLAEELGVSESPPESPEAPASAPVPVIASSLGGRVFSREPNNVRFTAQEKGKGRVSEVPGARGAKSVGEKENGSSQGIKRKLVGPLKLSPPLAMGSAAPGDIVAVKKPKLRAQGSTVGNGKSGSGSGSRARVMAKLPVSSAAAAKNPGPRRVLVDSAEAPRGWRG